MHTTNAYKLVREEFPRIANHKVMLKNFAILNQLRHPNILELLTSYTHRNTHNLVFPLAEDGTLADIFASTRQITPFKSNEALYIALAGLSSAIEAIHNISEHRLGLNLIGCHKNLHPSNIFVSRGTLILSGFYLSVFKPLGSPETLFEYVNGVYQAPECEDLDDDHQRHVVHQSSDIWSFGCIIAEAITYMVLGPDAVEEFRMRRSFTTNRLKYSYFHRGPGKTNEAVNDWLLMLEHKSLRTCKMLVELSRRMLIIDEKRRPNAKEVTARLQFIAYHEVVDAVDDLFLRVLESSDSVHARMEQKRFESWKYAMGMLDQNITLNLLDNDNFAMKQIAEFDTILDCLSQIRGCLHSISTQTQNMDQSIVVLLRPLNDRLIEPMGKTRQEKYRNYFEASVFKSESILDDESAIESSVFSIQSMASSAFTGNSVLTYAETKKATEELVSIFLDDQEMGAHWPGTIHPKLQEITHNLFARPQGREPRLYRHRIGKFYILKSQVCGNEHPTTTRAQSREPQERRIFSCTGTAPGYYESPG
jgi:serine/threonine protein kinase